MATPDIASLLYDVETSLDYLLSVTAGAADAGEVADQPDTVAAGLRQSAEAFANAARRLEGRLLNIAQAKPDSQLDALLQEKTALERQLQQKEENLAGFQDKARLWKEQVDRTLQQRALLSHSDTPAPLKPLQAS